MFAGTCDYLASPLISQSIILKVLARETKRSMRLEPHQKSSTADHPNVGEVRIVAGYPNEIFSHLGCKHFNFVVLNVPEP